MSDLISRTKDIQRLVGVKADGIYGPLTAGAVWAGLNRDVIDAENHALPSAECRVISDQWQTGLDERTISNIETLDEKVRENFAQFARLAKATAATLGCDYVMISGNRTWEEQDALYAKRPKVTNARGGQSNHNFGIAGDFGVFRNGDYLDNDNPTLATKVHRACSEHAAGCGLEWGGSWKSFVDLPHYEFSTGLTMAEKRGRFTEKGAIV